MVIGRMTKQLIYVTAKQIMPISRQCPLTLRVKQLYEIPPLESDRDDCY